MMPDAKTLWKSKRERTTWLRQLAQSRIPLPSMQQPRYVTKHWGVPVESEVEQIVDPAGENRDGEARAEESVTEQDTETPVAAEQLLELILEAHEARAAQEPLPKTVDGVVIARVTSVDENGVVRVAYPGTTNEGVPARVMTRVTTDDVGRDAALLFENSDSEKPVLMGLLFRGQTTASSPSISKSEQRATVDDQRIVLSAEREIVLECGEASITLTRAGKILIKGSYVLSRSSGTNRIQGGSVQIN